MKIIYILVSFKEPKDNQGYVNIDTKIKILKYKIIKGEIVI